MRAAAARVRALLKIPSASARENTGIPTSCQVKWNVITVRSPGKRGRTSEGPPIRALSNYKGRLLAVAHQNFLPRLFFSKRFFPQTQYFVLILYQFSCRRILFRSRSRSIPLFYWWIFNSRRNTELALTFTCIVLIKIAIAMWYAICNANFNDLFCYYLQYLQQ